MRAIHDVLEQDPQAELKYSFFDIALENVRDLLKYAKREQKKQIAHQSGFEIEGANSYGGNGNMNSRDRAANLITQ